MMMVLRAALVLGGFVFMVIGSGFLLAPVQMGAMFGVEAAGRAGPRERYGGGIPPRSSWWRAEHGGGAAGARTARRLLVAAALMGLR